MPESMQEKLAKIVYFLKKKVSEIGVYSLSVSNCVLAELYFDILIASIVIANNCILVTNNTEHFERIHGLQMQDWLGKNY
ncbi:MAG: hypothetical protein U0586_06075 [Candidatus Brocadiaceae bacterium]